MSKIIGFFKIKEYNPNKVRTTNIVNMCPVLEYRVLVPIRNVSGEGNTAGENISRCLERYAGGIESWVKEADDSNIKYRIQLCEATIGDDEPTYLHFLLDTTSKDLAIVGKLMS